MLYTINYMNKIKHSKNKRIHQFIFVFTLLIIAFISLSFSTGLNKKTVATVIPPILDLLINEERLQHDLSKLKKNDLLTEAAKLKAEDMIKNNYFNHTSPSGQTPWYWLDVVGYNYDYAGENIGVDFDSSEQLKEAWMKSSTHRSNILKDSFTEIGTGVATGTFRGSKIQFVVQLYARPQQ